MSAARACTTIEPPGGGNTSELQVAAELGKDRNAVVRLLLSDRPEGSTRDAIGEDIEPRPGVLKVNQMKLIQPSVDEIVKGIPEVIEQWRDTFGI